MHTKKLLTLATAVVLMAAITAGVTLAYFTASDTRRDTLTIGQVDVDLVEEKWTPDSEMTFNDTIVKDPVIVVAESSAPCYVRLQMDIDPTLRKVLLLPGIDDDQGRLALADGFDWSGPDAAGHYYFTYRGIARPGQRLPVFEYVRVRDYGPINAGDLDAADRKSMRLTAQAIQAEGFADSASAFAVFDEHYATK